VHWSDLHLTANGARRVEGGEGGNVCFRRLLATHLPALRRAEAILLTGDITDTGAAEEWREFFDAVPSELIGKITIVPGNHDLNIPDIDIGGVPVGARILRNILALNTVQGQRAKILDKHGNLVRLSDFLRQNFEELNAVLRGRRYTSHGLIRYLWKFLFPMAIEYPKSKLVVLVLNSNRLANNFITNALGTIGQESIERLGMMLEKYSTKRQIIALHHHIAFPPLEEGLLSKLQSTGMVLDDGRRLVSALPNNRGRVIFHGHRHIEYQGTIGSRLQIVSAPSTTLGNDLTGDPAGFYVFPIFTDRDMSTFISKPRWCG
jgi:predicted phosphodiesterase